MLPTPSPKARWWMERELFLLILILSVALFARISAVPLRGEETRWGQAAMEMRYFGDWMVIRENGNLLYSRPPLHPWLIAGSEAVFGTKDRFGLRFPSVIAVILTSILIYGYARQFLGRLGATASALAFPSGGEVFYTAQLAETDAVYILFLASGLLLWHWGYTNKWRSVYTWGAAYGLSALACLCKGGLQPPVYLIGGIGLFLLWNRDLRYAFSWGHPLGLAVGIAIAAAWAVPCAESVGWPTAKQIWMSDTSSRFIDWPVGEVLWHLVSFPADSLPGVFPWCVLALGLLLPDFRRRLASGPGCIQFCFFAFLIALPTIWIPPGGRTRYLMPLFPCLAILVGAIVDRVVEVPVFTTAWRRFLLFWSIVMALLAGVILTGGWILRGTRAESLSLSPVQAVCHGLVLLTLALVLAYARRAKTNRAIAIGIWALAIATLEMNAGVITDIRQNKINDIEASFAGVEKLIPPNQSLVAVGDIHSDIAFCLGRVITHPNDIESIADGSYFCFDRWGVNPPEIPFAWEQIAAVPVDRMRKLNPECTIVIARRIPSPRQRGI